MGLAGVVQAQASEINDLESVASDSVERYLDVKRGNIKDNPWALSFGMSVGSAVYKGNKHNVGPLLNFGYY